MGWPTPSTKKARQCSTELQFFFFILLDFTVGVASGGLAGLSFYREREGVGVWIYSWDMRGYLPWYLAVEAAGLLTSLMALLTSGAEFGWPDMRGQGHWVVQVPFLLWMLAVTFACGGVSALWLPHLSDLGMLAEFILMFPTVLAGPRGWPLLVTAVAMFAVGCLAPSALWLKAALFTAVCSFTKYLHDQRLVFCILLQPLTAYSIGAQYFLAFVAHSWVMAAGVFLPGLLTPYVNLLLRRHCRHLPAGLRRVKFVRLGYIRELVARGQCIRRCQELPDDAFGNPGKSAHLIILSHRWLDQSTCDVATDDCPCGLKLQSLLRRLERHFSPWHACGGHAQRWSWAARLHAACCVGGWDVLIFFDYMSVPQNGVAEDGSVIPRTPMELEIFKECLPNMGTLYSLFPVLALTDVPSGDTGHEYFESGWCVSEFSIATLGKQLHRHSLELLREQADMGMRRTFSQMMTSADARIFKQQTSIELENLHFTHDSDRIVAREVVEGFLAKRMLADFTRRGAVDELFLTLAGLTFAQREATLNQPVDAGLNTLLHVAVQAGQPKAVERLLACGARSAARNLHGDTPTQFFALPRLGRAARQCRKLPQVQPPVSIVVYTEI